MDCVACAAALPPGARFCPSCGTPGAPSSAPAAEERKLVTVVFCDLVGSTPLSERLDPETLRSVTLRYFSVMRERIEQFGGTVEKFIGDAVMAVFGVPVMHEDDARRAAAAALGMIEALADLNTQLEPSLGVSLQVRIGVNTGPAVTGADVAARQALVSGETVNVAARLEQNAGSGEILIGPVTLEAIGPTARTEPVGPLRLKGKEEPVLAHRLLGVGRDDPESGRRFDLPFIGRGPQLAALDAALARAAADGARLLTVYGEPGIGKTRLARAWLAAASGSPVLGLGRCRPYGEDGSLTALAEAVRGLRDRPGGWHIGDAEALAVLDAGLLRDGSPGPSAEATCRALARVLAEAGDGRPVVLVLDDCQWAGDPLLDLLDHLVAAAGPAPLLVVCLARLDLAERRPPAPRADPRSSSLTLPVLSYDECELLGATLAEVGAHAAGALAEVIDRSGGNPLHLEQLLAAALDGEPLERLPHSLQALLGARIDGLGHPERTALELAAVLGREFAGGDLAALAAAGPEGIDGPLRPEPLDPVPGALRRLGRRRLIEPAAAAPRTGAGGPDSLRFSSALVHEATYQAMAKRTRADRHERTAALLADRTAPTAVVAGHLERAYRYRAELGLRDEAGEALRRRAADLLTAAGDRALGRWDLAWAGALLERAADLAEPGDPGWAGTVRRLGEVRVAAGRIEEGRALLRAVLDAAGEPLETAHAGLALAVCDPREPVVAAARAARAALPRFQAAGDELGMARAGVRMAQEQQLLGRHDEATELLTVALHGAAACGAEPEIALALGALGISLWRGPTPVPRALERCRALLAEHAGPRPGIRITLSCPTAVLLALDDRPDEARGLLDQARRAAERLGYAEAAMVLPVFAAVVESWSGPANQALESLDRAHAAAREAGAVGMLSMIARERARILLQDGHVDEAAALLSTPHVHEALLRSDAADLYGLQARVTAARGEGEKALLLAGRAISHAARTDSPELRAVAALDQAAVFELLGQPAAAGAAATTALRHLRDKGHLPGVRRAAELQARYDPARGRDRGGEEA
jgi:class 3 adenylate cyclase/tetratricopeptide (TPR) repeat protein